MREIADASIACRFAQLEAGVALARALDRTLVLPSWTVMITTAPFEKLVRLCTEDELKASFSRTNTAGIAFVRVELSSIEGSGPWLDDEPDSNVNVVFKEDLSALKSQSVANHATHEEQLRLDAPMRPPTTYAPPRPPRSLRRPGSGFRRHTPVDCSVVHHQSVRTASASHPCLSAMQTVTAAAGGLSPRDQAAVRRCARSIRGAQRHCGGGDAQTVGDSHARGGLGVCQWAKWTKWTKWTEWTEWTKRFLS